MPVIDRISLVDEIVKLRGRLHALENELTLVKFTGRFAGGIGGPAEMPPPELGEGELRPPPQEISEAEIAELQAMPEFVQRAVTALVDQRIAAAMERVLNEIGGLKSEVQQLSKGKR